MNMPNNGIHAYWSNKYEDYFYCSHCGIGAPFARYRRKNGINARDLTDYCPNCGALMDEIEKCKTCDWSYYSKKNWNSGVCLYCHIGERYKHSRESEE